MATRREAMIEQVRIEAKNLKKHATKDELNRLDFNSITPYSTKSCVYGQMTGLCFSHRATELIKKCAVRIYHGRDPQKAPINGAAKNAERAHDSTNSYWSPIEVFIIQDSGMFDDERSDEYKFQKKQNDKLISYLKGKTRTLNLK